MTALFGDVRHTFRQLRRGPGFAVAAVLTLALGIGANTAIFSAVNGLLLRPPPGVRALDDLVAIYTSDYSGPAFGASSLPDVEDFSAGTPALSGITAYTIAPVVFGGTAGGRAAALVAGQVVTANYFDVLGVRITTGRSFSKAEGEPGSPAVVILGDAFWQSRYGGDPSILGRVIQLAGQPVTVIGVAPAGFTGLLPGIVPAFFTTTVTGGRLGLASPDERGSRGSFVIGRLATGATLRQASDQLGRVAASLHERHPGEWTDVRDEPRRVTVLPASNALVPPQVRGPVTAFVAVLMAVVGAVLLIGCANIANLLLARATARRREIAVRTAIGATRGRLIRQLLTESMILAGIGGVIGVALAYVLTRLLAGVELPLPVEVRLNVTPDLRVLAFAALVSVLAGVLFGLAPALLATRRTISASLRDHSASGSGAAGRKLGLRALLAGGQISVAVVLLVAGGLLVRSLRSAQSIDPGFRVNGMVFASLAQDDAASSPDRRAVFARTLRQRLDALPGVRAVSFVRALPLSLGQSRRSFSVEGYTPGRTEDMELYSTFAGPGFFTAMGIPLLRGRDFDDADATSDLRVAVVNQAFIDRYMNGRDPIGRRLGNGSGPLDIEIVGLAPTGKYVSLGEDPVPFVWLSSSQAAAVSSTIVIRVDGAVAPAASAIRGIVGDIDPSVAVTSIGTAGQQLAFALLPQRIGAWLLGLFGALGLTLAMVGIYGVMAFAVSRRTREIGVRLALGARSADVVRMVVVQGMRVATIAALAGTILAAGAAQLLRFLLFDTQPLDPPTFVGVIGLVLGVSLLANWLPARRTAAVDPVDALRYD